MIITPVIATLLYIGFIWWKFGVLDSISDSFYVLDEKMGTIWSVLFTLWTWWVGIPFIQAGPKLYLASGICMCMVGIVPVFRWKGFVGIFHMVMATSAICLALTEQISHAHYLAVILAVGLSITIPRLKVTHQTWWVELSCFSAIMLGELIQI